MAARKKPSPLRQVFARNVRAGRAQLGWSQEKLGERAGLSQVYLSEVENGKRAVSIDAMDRIAQALSRKAGHLLLSEGE